MSPGCQIEEGMLISLATLPPSAPILYNRSLLQCFCCCNKSWCRASHEPADCPQLNCVPSVLTAGDFGPAAVLVTLLSLFQCYPAMWPPYIQRVLTDTLALMVARYNILNKEKLKRGEQKYAMYHPALSRKSLKDRSKMTSH